MAKFGGVHITKGSKSQLILSALDEHGSEATSSTVFSVPARAP